MMPIFSMLIKNSGGGGGGGAVNFSNESVFDSVIDPANASCGYTISGAGTWSGTGTAGGTWLVSGVAGDYEFRATVTSGALTSGTTGTWIAAGNSWTVTRTVFGVSTAIVDFECRRVSDSVVIATWTIDFTATVDA